MKNRALTFIEALTVFAIVVILVVLVTAPLTYKRRSKTNLEAVPSRVTEIHGYYCGLMTVAHEGHDFTVAKLSGGVAMIHSPGCVCLTK